MTLRWRTMTSWFLLPSRAAAALESIAASLARLVELEELAQGQLPDEGPQPGPVILPPPPDVLYADDATSFAQQQDDDRLPPVELTATRAYAPTRPIPRWRAQ